MKEVAEKSTKKYQPAFALGASGRRWSIAFTLSLPHPANDISLVHDQAAVAWAVYWTTMIDGAWTACFTETLSWQI